MRTAGGVTRREFVKGSGVAAFGMPMIVASRALGGQEKPSPSERVTVGFIGVGKQNLGHLKHYAGRKDVQVLAVCDVDTTRRENAKAVVEKKYGDKEKGDYKGCAAYNDFRELL